MKKLFLIITILTLTISCGTKEKTDTSAQLDTTLTVSYFGAQGKTVLKLLETSHRIEKKSSSIGSFVESIDGVKNRSNRFWLYYVNGKKPDVASDRYTTHTNDTVEWRFEAAIKEEK